MFFSSLRLQNFRNYNELNLLFEERGAVFVGSNAAGKTNILEALAMLALTKSPRVSQDRSLIQWQKDWANVEGGLNKNPRRVDLSLHLVKNGLGIQKTVRQNKETLSPKSYFGVVSLVGFFPDDVTLPLTTPAVRRRWLDSIAALTEPTFIEAAASYRQALVQRNRLLNEINAGTSPADLLDSWDQALAQHGALVVNIRKQTVDRLNQQVSKIYRIFSSDTKCSLTYQASQAGLEERSKFLAFLKSARSRDVKYRRTTVGPHRDDIIILLNKHRARTSASRGELRSAVLSLKLSQLELQRQTADSQPIVLLDDVFSELDDKRKKALLTAVGNNQTFITTTSRRFLPDVGDKFQVFSITNGKIDNVS